LNAIQDRFADLSNFSQTVDVNAIRIGASDLQLVNYGAGEARVTGALRTDGLLRGLGGVLPGAFTTAQRDAIATGMAPTGTIIYNSSVGRLQFNIGTDASREWQSLESQTGAQQPTGRFVGELTWFSGNTPVTGIVEPVSGWLVCNGVAISRTTYAALFGVTGTAYGAGDAATTFNLPNLSDGKVLLPGGPGFARGAVGGAATVTLTGAQVPSHTHTISSDGAHSHPMGTLDHAHQHALSQVSMDAHKTIENIEGYGLVESPWFKNLVLIYSTAIPKTGVHGDTDGVKNSSWSGAMGSAGAHGHGGVTGANAGGGSPHDNMPPYQVAGQVLIKY
jgi:microcystin-dependent protein